MEDTQQPVDQQVTSKTPGTKQKNPKRVAAGKAIAEKTRLAREAQKKALIEAQSIIAQAKHADPPAPEPPAPEPPSAKVFTKTMDWRYRHHRFIGGDLLQTRRAQKRFC